MSSYDDDLLKASHHLLTRRAGQRGRLPSALIRRSISTTYYALFHFLTDEAANRLIGADSSLRQRRRLFVRAFTHAGMRITLSKISGSTIDSSVENLLRGPNAQAGRVTPPAFVQDMAKAFLDAQAKREDADYDLNASLSEVDAKKLRSRASRAISGWRTANSIEDRDFKHALCMLLLLKGQVRREH